MNKICQERRSEKQFIGMLIYLLCICFTLLRASSYNDLEKEKLILGKNIPENVTNAYEAVMATQLGTPNYISNVILRSEKRKCSTFWLLKFHNDQHS